MIILTLRETKELLSKAKIELSDEIKKIIEKYEIRDTMNFLYFPEDTKEDYYENIQDLTTKNYPNLSKEEIADLSDILHSCSFDISWKLKTFFFSNGDIETNYIGNSKGGTECEFISTYPVKNDKCVYIRNIGTTNYHIGDYYDEEKNYVVPYIETITVIKYKTI